MEPSNKGRFSATFEFKTRRDLQVRVWLAALDIHATNKQRNAKRATLTNKKHEYSELQATWLKYDYDSKQKIKKIGNEKGYVGHAESHLGNERMHGCCIILHVCLHITTDQCAFLGILTLTKLHRKIAHSLGHRLDLHWLVVCEPVVLTRK